ncbi:MAG: helix-turn-helix domain-containing protein [bacterium]|nr:helix-turn-helix domain-containing protein [bacterium]
MEISDGLRKLGLNTKQSLAYAALLELGPSTAYAIARKSGIKRPTVYVLLEELRIKDAVLKIPHAKKQIFIAKSPDELVARAFEDIQEVSKILPKLRALMSKENRPKIFYYEGVNELRQLLWRNLSAMKNKELVGFYAYNPGLPKKTIHIIDDYNEYLKTNGIRVRGIVPNHPSLRQYRQTDKEFGRSNIVVPFSQYSSKISVDMGEDFVRILALRDQQGVIIENKDVAEGMRQIFDLVWKKKS